MPVFAVIPLASDSSSLDAAVEKIFLSPADKFKLASNSGWLDVFDGTTKAVCDHIGITGQPKGDPAPIGLALVLSPLGFGLLADRFETLQASFHL